MQLQPSGISFSFDRGDFPSTSRIGDVVNGQLASFCCITNCELRNNAAIGVGIRFQIDLRSLRINHDFQLRNNWSRWKWPTIGVHRTGGEPKRPFAGFPNVKLPSVRRLPIQQLPLPGGNCHRCPGTGLGVWVLLRQWPRLRRRDVLARCFRLIRRIGLVCGNRHVQLHLDGRCSCCRNVERDLERVRIHDHIGNFLCRGGTRIRDRATGQSCRHHCRNQCPPKRGGATNQTTLVLVKSHGLVKIWVGVNSFGVNSSVTAH